MNYSDIYSVIQLCLAETKKISLLKDGKNKNK